MLQAVTHNTCFGIYTNSGINIERKHADFEYYNKINPCR